jgi:trigger factor
VVNVKVDVEEIGSVKRKLKVVVPRESVQEELTKAYDKLKKEVTIKGFRKGKTPKSILDRYYKEKIEFDVLNKLVNDTYQKAIKENAMKPISNPQLEEKGEIKAGEEFHYTAVVEVKPVFEVKDYLGLEYEKKKVSITAEDVAKKMEELKDMYSSLKEVEEERALKIGDFGLVDYEGTINGKPFKGSKGEDQVIEIRDASEQSDFSSQLAGLMRGEGKDVEVSYPADYFNKELAGNTVQFSVTVKGIKEKVVPELNDEFAKDVGQYASIDELKKKLKEELVETRKKEVKAELHNEICRKIAEKNPIEVPEALVEAQIQTNLATTKYRLAQQGLQLDNLDLNDQKIREEMKESAERTVKEGLILEAIAEAEGIEVDKKDIDGIIEDMSRQTGKDVESLRKMYQNEEALERLMMRTREEKTLDFLIERAKIKEQTKKTKKKK